MFLKYNEFITQWKFSDNVPVPYTEILSLPPHFSVWLPTQGLSHSASDFALGN